MDWHPRDRRYSIDWPVTLTRDGDSTLFEGRIFNISMGGAGFLCTTPFVPGENLRILVQVPDFISERALLPNPMPLHLEVLWCREHLNINQLGTRYRYLSPIVRHAIHDAFEAFSSSLVKPGSTTEIKMRIKEPSA